MDVIGGATRPPKRATSWTRCADCSGGRSKSVRDCRSDGAGQEPEARQRRGLRCLDRGRRGALPRPVAGATKERVWLDVLLHTGLRRGDAVRLGKQHVRNGEATIRTEKSNFEVEITIPIVPELQVTLDAGPTGDLAFICGERGYLFTKESFGNPSKSACKAAASSGRRRTPTGSGSSRLPSSPSGGRMRRSSTHGSVGVAAVWPRSTRGRGEPEADVEGHGATALAQDRAERRVQRNCPSPCRLRPYPQIPSH